MRRLLALGVLLAWGAAGADQPPAVRGTWQRHQYSFVAMGFTSTYSCDGLAAQLKVLLLAAGARADVKSQPGACPADFGHPDPLARAELVFYTLLPDAGSEPGGTLVEGTWRPVQLSSRSPRELAVGDCELVQQFREQVLPMFATRDLADQSTCVPHQESGSVINLRFESFMAAPLKSR